MAQPIHIANPSMGAVRYSREMWSRSGSKGASVITNQAGKNVAVLSAAERLGATEYQVVLAWMLSFSHVMLPIPGTGSPAHAADNIAAAGLELTGDEERAIRDGG